MPYLFKFSFLFCRGIGSSNPLAVAVATAKKNLGGNEQLALAVYENHYREGWALLFIYIIST